MRAAEGEIPRRYIRVVRAVEEEIPSRYIRLVEAAEEGIPRRYIRDQSSESSRGRDS